MNHITRRSALGWSAAALGLGRSSFGQSVSPLPPFGFPSVGRLRPRSSASIAASPLSVGFETLDRGMFNPDRAYGALAQLGVKWARAQTGWARTERKKGEYDFRWLDEVVDSLRKAGIQPWFNLGYGNRLYTPGAPHESAVGYVPMNSPEARAAWLAYVARAAEHFRGRVRHWEIWNEPNGGGFWRPNQPNPERYAELVAITAPVIRKRDADAVIVGGALAGLGNTFDFARRALDRGMAGHIDKLSYHPYRAIPEANYDSEVRAMRRLLAKYKPGIELWQGENGAPSLKGGAGHPFELDGTEAGQAKWLLRRILTDLRLDLELTSYFHTVDLANYIWSDGQSGKTQRMGLLRDDYTPKQSYVAYQSLCTLFDADSKRADLLVMFTKADADEPRSRHAEDIEGVSSVAFVRHGRPIYAYWRPSDLSQPSRAEQVGASLWSAADGELTTPVLVDPIDAQIYRLDGRRNGNYTELDRIPLLDYPLIITDASVVTPARG